MSAPTMTEVLRTLRTDGEWLRRAKHATTEVIDAGNTMLKAADEIEALSSALREMREALMQLVPFLDDLDESPHSVGVYPDVACSRRCRDAVAAARAAIEKATKP